MHHQNVYRRNVVTDATANPVMPNPDAIDQEFAESANRIVLNGVEIVRQLMGAHQSAIAIVINKDWRYVRKFFSLSEKYAAWADYDTPAVGYGIHAWLLEANKPVRMSQAELENHPEWKNFGTESGKHSPMRGWMAAPIIDRNGVNWGLIQLSDRYEGDFTEDDEKQFLRFAELVSQALEAIWEVRNLKKQQSS